MTTDRNGSGGHRRPGDDPRRRTPATDGGRSTSKRTTDPAKRRTTSSTDPAKRRTSKSTDPAKRRTSKAVDPAKRRAAGSTNSTDAAKRRTTKAVDPAKRRTSKAVDPAKRRTSKSAEVAAKRTAAKRPAVAKQTAGGKRPTAAGKRPSTSRQAPDQRVRGKRPGAQGAVRKGRGTPRRPVSKRPARPPRTLRLGRPALRLRIAFFVMAFVLSLFAGRLVLLQGVDPDSYALAAAKENTQSYPLHASRGSILDRDGVPLAVSDDAVAIVADPKQTSPVASRLTTLLTDEIPGIGYEATIARLQKPNSRFERIARKVSPQTWNRIKAAMKEAGLVGLYTQPDPVRSHPNGDVASNVVGYVGAEGDGLGGLEYSLNKQLSGEDGKAIYEVDKRGNRIPLANHTVAEPKPGISAQLTIDRDLQWYAQQRIARQVKLTGAESGSVVTMDVKTGEVLVAATYPSFDPDKPGTAKSDARGNRILEQVYEPGSVQKVVTMAALADAGKIDLNTKVKVPPSIRVSGKTIHDHFDHGNLNLTISGVVAKSSNLGTIVVARKMAIPTFVKYLYNFGFGRPTGTNFPGESRGLMPPGDEWSELTRSNVAFGQGISANALQMTAAVNAVANGGVYVPPKLIRNYVDSNGNDVPAAGGASRRVVSAQAAKQVAQMMEAVTGPGGTAKTAQIPGYRVAGKTGTAQEVDSKCGCYRKWATSFAGFAPADNPRFVTYVVLQNPTNGRSGGGQGGPVFQNVMSYALQKYAVPPTGAKAPNLPLTW